jgi:VIT1/CCC1 family predicted Fe2+/Mn2+ transporter
MATMTGRTFTLVSVATVIGVLALLTIVLAVNEGLSARVVLSLVILAIFGFGVVGALRHDPDE